MNTLNLFTISNLAQSLTFIVTLLPFSGAFATGGVNGGGGKGVLCGDQVTVLDIYEANQNKLPIPAPLGNTDGEVDRFGLRFFKHFSTAPLKKEEESTLLQYMKDILNQKDDPAVKSGFIFKWERNLPFTNDATLPRLQPGCEFVQIGINRIVKVNDEEKTEITLDPYYWAKLNSINKLAIFFHEFSYSRERSGYDLNDIERAKLTSDETRKVIGLILSGSDIPNIIGSVTDSKYSAWCGFGGGTVHGGNEERFEIYIQEEIQNDQKGLGLYFYGFKERLVASQTYAFLPNFEIDQILHSHFPSRPAKGPIEERYPSFPTQTIAVTNSLMNKTWVMHLGTDQWGLSIQAFDLDTPNEKRPNLSAGSCSLKVK